MTHSAPKCLLVDDSDSMLRLLEMYMENLGFESVTARDGDEGLSVFREQQPCLVVSDIHMPNRNGLELLRDIKHSHPEVPVILITGFLNYKSDLNVAGNQPDWFMEKPFSLDQLREAVETLQPAINRVRDQTT